MRVYEGDDTEGTRRVVRLPPQVSTPKDRKPCLLIVHGDKAGDLIRLDRPEITVGRSPQADVVLQDDGVSRMHAKVVLRDDGRVELVDLNSTNGTYVEGRPVSASFLTEGDSIGIGSVEIFRFGHYADNEAALQHQLYTTATRDGLTGALNKRHFMVRLRQEFELSLRTGVPLSAVMFDVDFFKSVNDNHGHSAGDEVLKLLVERIRPHLRMYDLFARYGGEEFSMVLRQTELEKAIMIAERTRRLVCDTPFPMPAMVEERELRISISLGVALLDTPTMPTPELFLHSADMALYQAKASGRNKVCVHGQA